jgi:hypothetical protein
MTNSDLGVEWCHLNQLFRDWESWQGHLRPTKDLAEAIYAIG